MAKNTAHTKRNIVGFVVMRTVVREDGEFVRSLGDNAEIVSEFMIKDFGSFDSANNAAWNLFRTVAADNAATSGYMVWNIYRNGDRDVR